MGLVTQPQLILKETLGRLPTSEYELVDNGNVVGKIQVRHKPSHGGGIPESMASHIYYEIIPEHRSKRSAMRKSQAFRYSVLFFIIHQMILTI